MQFSFLAGDQEALLPRSLLSSSSDKKFLGGVKRRFFKGIQAGRQAIHPPPAFRQPPPRICSRDDAFIPSQVPSSPFTSLPLLLQSNAFFSPSSLHAYSIHSTAIGPAAPHHAAHPGGPVWPRRRRRRSILLIMPLSVTFLFPEDHLSLLGIIF